MNNPIAKTAYVFWHRPFANIDKDIYESALTAFHREFAKRAPDSFRGSATYRIPETPWLDGMPGYEDWNFVTSPASFDPLNESAVAPDMWDIHADISSKTDIGHGGVYYHVFGTADPRMMTRTAWLRRPRGIRYQEPIEQLANQAKGPVSVWRKQMVLGPAPEFALLSDQSLSLDLPAGWEALYVDRALLYASP